jgi:hypothetical protein
LRAARLRGLEQGGVSKARPCLGELSKSLPKRRLFLRLAAPVVRRAAQTNQSARPLFAHRERADNYSTRSRSAAGFRTFRRTPAACVCRASGPRPSRAELRSKMRVRPGPVTDAPALRTKPLVGRIPLSQTCASQASRQQRLSAPTPFSGVAVDGQRPGGFP